MNRRLDDEERRLWAFVAGDPHLRRLPGRLPPEFRFAPRPGGPYGPTREAAPEAPPPSTIDLHGMNVDQAYAALEAFLRAALSVHAQVLVIVGRGEVLRTQVPRWVRHGALHACVRECREAPAESGGAGAFVLRLRRRSAHRI